MKIVHPAAAAAHGDGDAGFFERAGEGADVNCEARSGSNISGLLNVAKASSSAPHHARSALDTQSMTATR
jgi:hypothetical protein